MKKVDNKIFLEFLEKDIIKNFYLCDNIVNSGKDGYAIKSVEIFFCRNITHYGDKVYESNIEL